MLVYDADEGVSPKSVEQHVDAALNTASRAPAMDDLETELAEVVFYPFRRMLCARMTLTCLQEVAALNNPQRRKYLRAIETGSRVHTTQPHCRHCH